jgi:leucyl aminopeptidase
LATISLTTEPGTTVAGDVLVVGMAKGAKGPTLVLGADDRALRPLAAGLVALGLTGAADEVARIPAPPGVSAAVVLLTGLGDVSRRYAPETLRRAAGAATRALVGSSKVVLGLPAGTAAEVEAVALGALLGSYTFNTFRTRSADKARDGVRSLVLSSGLDAAGPAGARQALARAKAIGGAVCLTRDLVNTPPNVLTPRAFADIARTQSSSLDLAFSALDDKALRKGGYGGILGVGQGSANPPTLVRIAYRHPKATRHLALVGKGITFDTGGISIKPAPGMELMKSDMGGAAAVLGTMLAVGRLRPVVNVTGWMPMAENMPSGSAQRPSDVLTTYGGRTVEVLNTDAEGRLVLADAMVASLADSPDVLIDVATLTGAQLVALGARTGGIMSNDDTLRGRIHDASEHVGEALWPMPLPEEMRKGLDSAVADIANIDNARLGGMLSGGIFLREFVPSGLPWAHIDVAGPAFNSGAGYGYTPKGATGVTVRTLVRLAEELAAGRL